MVLHIFLHLILVFFTKMMLPALTVNFKTTFNCSFHHSNQCCLISVSVLLEIKLSVKAATQRNLASILLSEKTKRNQNPALQGYCIQRTPVSLVSLFFFQQPIFKCK